MTDDNVVELTNPAENIVTDYLTDFIRESACKMLKVAIEAEVTQFITQFNAAEPTNSLPPALVRNGYLPKRSVKTGVGDIEVQIPRVRDRRDTPEKVNFTSGLVPKYMRRTVTLDVMLPLLYLKGISTNEFAAALAPMLGENAKTISPAVISKLKSGWYEDYLAWQKQDLSDKQYVYWWVDGVYSQARMETDKNCMLVIVGADEQGKKELVALVDGFRESKDSWLSLLRDLRARGLTQAPKLAVGDGALGFWGALHEVYPTTACQRCWVHKTANVLEKLPKSQQGKAKSMLHNIYLAASKQDAETAIEQFSNDYVEKYPKAVNCLAKDEGQLLNFYDFPAEHWVHIRTTNPIESTFATVKHRTRQSRGCFSRNTIVGSTFKLMLEASKRWKRLYGYKKLADVINGVQFKDGSAIETEHLVQKENKAA